MLTNIVGSYYLEEFGRYLADEANELSERWVVCISKHNPRSHILLQVIKLINLYKNEMHLL